MRIGINGSFVDRPNTGSGQYLRGLLPALAACDPAGEFAVIAPENESTGREVRELSDVAPRTFLCPEAVALARWSENLGKVWFEQISFGRACLREHVALAHVPYFASPLFPATRTVVTIHDIIPMLLPLYRGSPLVRLYTRLVAAGAGRAGAVIADSECSKRDIVKHLGLPAERVRVIHLAAGPRFHPVEDATTQEAIRAKYALPERYLLYFGGFDQRKNVRVLVEAFGLLKDLYQSGYRLALAGSALGNDSAFFPSPLRTAEQVGLPEDAIRYLGWVPEQDKPALYAGAAAFLFPSLYEGFGLPPLEAMACGTPVICSNASSLPEIVGDAAVQVDPSDAVMWAESIRAVVGDPNRQREMRERGLAQARQFSWARTAEETLAVYRSVA